MSRSGSFRCFSLRAFTFGLAALLAVGFALPAHADSQARIVRLSDVQGSVQIDKNSGLGFENAFLNLPVTQGAQIRTRDNGRVEIEFEDGSTLRLAPNSKLEFSQLGLSDAGTRVSVISLVDGTAYVNWLGKGSDQFTLNFSREKVDLTRAAHFRVDTSPELTKVAVFKGDLQVEAPSGAVTVAKKKMASFNADDQVLLAKGIEEEPLDSWDKESTSYHEQYARNNSSPYGYGVSDLNYYGSYTSVPGYGMMWQPYFTTAGWDPFMDGAWSWYPGFGYMFVSAYPWGWMPYRYGNWVSVPGSGWMWQPGNWNSWATVPRYSPGAALGFHVPVVPSGTVSTVPVGKVATALSPAMPSHLTITRGSAGMGVPRGAVEDLKSLNHQVTKSGLVQLQAAPQYSAARSSASYASRASSGYSAATAAPSVSSSGHAGSVSSSHSSSVGHH